MKRPTRRRNPEVRATTLLAPVTYLSLTTMLACVDAIVLTNSNSPSPVFRNPPATSAPENNAPENTADRPPEANVRPPTASAVVAFPSPSHLRVRLKRAVLGQAVQISVSGGWRLHVGSLPDLSRAPGALIAIGCRASMTERAIAVARKIGKVEVDHGETGCKTPDA